MRKLTLKKDTLTELSTDELTGVVAGTNTIRETLYSCMAFISCGVIECVPTFKGDCIE